MKALRVSTSDSGLLDPGSSAWRQIDPERVRLSATPLAIVKDKSPYLAISKGHGAVASLTASALHNGSVLTVKLDWATAKKNDRMNDLDEFVDAVAVLFPLSPDAAVLTMGSTDAPTNAWYWKADVDEPFDVLSNGYGNTVRRPGRTSGLRSQAAYHGESWSVTLQRPMAVNAAGTVPLVPGKSVGIAFAVWDGDNAERSGRKSFSGGYIDLLLA